MRETRINVIMFFTPKFGMVTSGVGWGSFELEAFSYHCGKPRSQSKTLENFVRDPALAYSESWIWAKEAKRQW